MRIVIWFADSRVSMRFLHVLDEPIPEFRSVIALKHVDLEPHFSFSFADESDARGGIHPVVRSGICPPGIHVEEDKDVHPFLLADHEMYGVDLHQIAWIQGNRAFLMRMEALVYAPLLQETVSV